MSKKKIIFMKWIINVGLKMSKISMLVKKLPKKKVYLSRLTW